MEKIRFLICSATAGELEPFSRFLLSQGWTAEMPFLGTTRIELLHTGVGMMETTYHLLSAVSKGNYNAVIHAGIAGTYRDDWELGSIVHVIQEEAGDLGAEEKDGNFLSLFDLKLMSPDEPPFRGGRLQNDCKPWIPAEKEAKGITVNLTAGTKHTAEARNRRFRADVESMEGLAVFYVCLCQGIPFQCIRSISNRVEERNRDSWEIPLSIARLNQSLIGYFGEGLA